MTSTNSNIIVQTMITESVVSSLAPQMGFSYRRPKDSSLFSFSSIAIAHPSAVESLASDLHYRRPANFGAGEVCIWRLDDSKPRNDCVATLANASRIGICLPF